MTPVYQEHFRDVERGIYGDCARAVLASLFNLPLCAVPHFLQEADTLHRQQGGLLSAWFHDRIDGWLLSRGYEINWYSRPLPVYAQDYCYIGGKSPRGNDLYHAVVGLNGQIVHDPYPHGGGLLEPQSWIYGYLMPLNVR